MLTSLRRGSASLAKSLLSVSTPLTRVNPSQASRSRQSIVSFTRSSLSIRTFVTSPPSYQYGSQTAAAVDEQLETNHENDAHPQNNQAQRHGPVTRFKDLSETGLVCETLVSTLTQDMGMETMTEVQSLTIHESLKGGDMCVK